MLEQNFNIFSNINSTKNRPHSGNPMRILLVIISRIIHVKEGWRLIVSTKTKDQRRLKSLGSPRTMGDPPPLRILGLFTHTPRILEVISNYPWIAGITHALPQQLPSSPPPKKIIPYWLVCFYHLIKNMCKDDYFHELEVFAAFRCKPVYLNFLSRTTWKETWR